MRSLYTGGCNNCFALKDLIGFVDMHLQMESQNDVTALKDDDLSKYFNDYFVLNYHYMEMTLSQHTNWTALNMVINNMFVLLMQRSAELLQAYNIVCTTLPADFHSDSFS